ncbi:hypothetical protein BC943DRAFT_189204 [Umbelopsis sp. AD052]|nr:hypothetical protein BC943DRAFT_189204 [Umbelopsis sp. AD052]
MKVILLGCFVNLVVSFMLFPYIESILYTVSWTSPLRRSSSFHWLAANVAICHAINVGLSLIYTCKCLENRYRRVRVNDRTLHINARANCFKCYLGNLYCL